MRFKLYPGRRARKRESQQEARLIVLKVLVWFRLSSLEWQPLNTSRLAPHRARPRLEWLTLRQRKLKAPTPAATITTAEQEPLELLLSAVDADAVAACPT